MAIANDRYTTASLKNIRIGSERGARGYENMCNAAAAPSQPFASGLFRLPDYVGPKGKSQVS